VNEAELAELRSTGTELKLRQLAALMFSTDAFGWSDALRSEDDIVRARWTRLREALLG
jgi:hypothetical protein